jgi:hypothetical protein
MACLNLWFTCQKFNFFPLKIWHLWFFLKIHFFLEIWQLWPIFFFQKNPLIEKQLLFFWLQSRRKIATKKMLKFTMKECFGGVCYNEVIMKGLGFKPFLVISLALFYAFIFITHLVWFPLILGLPPKCDLWISCL